MVGPDRVRLSRKEASKRRRVGTPNTANILTDDVTIVDISPSTGTKDMQRTFSQMSFEPPPATPVPAICDPYDIIDTDPTLQAYPGEAYKPSVPPTGVTATRGEDSSVDAILAGFRKGSD